MINVCLLRNNLRLGLNISFMELLILLFLNEMELKLGLIKRLFLLKVEVVDFYLVLFVLFIKGCSFIESKIWFSVLDCIV